MRNINTPKYWEERFSTGDWDAVGGREQTRSFAEAQIKYIKLGRNFNGTILDFGCGLGDAMPVYRMAYPHASLVGADISSAAIKQCVEKYGEIASFICSDHEGIPNADVIISSNVLEHLDNDVQVAQSLTRKCDKLFITVPYREELLIEEHVNTYHKHYFKELGAYRTKIFASIGWSQFGWKSVGYEIYFKNILRPLLNRKKIRRRMQIMFLFDNRQTPA